MVIDIIIVLKINEQIIYNPIFCKDIALKTHKKTFFYPQIRVKTSVMAQMIDSLSSIKIKRGNKHV